MRSHDNVIILCDSCSTEAVQGMAADLACRIDGIRFSCLGCKAPGKVQQVDDGEQAMLVFRVEET